MITVRPVADGRNEDGDFRFVTPTLEIDLLVMGAYGHARVREVRLSGATRDLLRHMTVPVLVSH